MTPEAYDFAASESALATATATVDKANTELNALQARLAEKQQALNIIQQRRVDSGGSNEDAPMVHLLQLDIAGLEPLVATAQTRQQSAVEALQAAQQQVQHCQQALERATALEAAQALESRLRELETLLLSGIAELHVLKKTATGSIHIHGPSLFNFSQQMRRFIATGVLIVD